MAGSNLLVDYLGKGLHAARPASLTLASGAASSGNLASGFASLYSVAVS